MTDLWTLLAILVSGLVSGVTGFGFGLVSMGALTTFLSVAEATALVQILSVCANGLNLWTVRREIVWRETWPVLAVGLPAIAGGVYLLTVLNEGLLRAGVASMILAGCVVMFWCPPGICLRRVFPWGYLAGVLGGIFNGALGMGGPPLVLYNALRRCDKVESKCLLSSFLTVMGLWRVALLIGRGLITWETARQGLLLLVPALAASWLGILVFRRMSAPVFRYATTGLLLALAVKLLV